MIGSLALLLLRFIAVMLPTWYMIPRLLKAAFCDLPLRKLAENRQRHRADRARRRRLPPDHPPAPNRPRPPPRRAVSSSIMLIPATLSGGGLVGAEKRIRHRGAVSASKLLLGTRLSPLSYSHLTVTTKLLV